ncbi:MAG: serine/threonine protein kinase, partial [Desulfobacteraceae bacterium]|nr:serine/threonine protein kinase [Desulfobacteraceae bacterium]
MKSITLSNSDYQITEKIYESDNSTIYRAFREMDGQATILKILKRPHLSSYELKSYRKDYDIMLHLKDLDGVVNVYGFENHQNKLVICLEDFGGESLEIWKNKHHSHTLGELLTIAIHLTDVLGQIHGQNIIHKNINPSNIIIDPTSYLLKMIDFGFSTQFSKQQIADRNPDTIEGSLAYISPEQTGRTNYDLDYRTDFYSLGATFYELFTGVVPFETTDGMELIHCHIAKKPKFPAQINPELPPAVSNIILKLLEKQANDRYQSIRGLKADLERCLEKWQTTGQIELFSLARFDLSDQFKIPQKLYGRDHEIKTLLDAFERVS